MDSNFYPQFTNVNCCICKRQHQVFIVASFWISSGSRYLFYRRIAITEVTKEMMPAVLNGALLKTPTGRSWAEYTPG